MALAVLWVVPLAILLTAGSKKIHDSFGTKNILNKRAVADCIQEGLETIRDIKACNRQAAYMGKLEEKLAAMEKGSVHSELATGELSFLYFNFYGNYFVGNPFEQYNSILFAGNSSEYRVYSNAVKYNPIHKTEQEVISGYWAVFSRLPRQLLTGAIVGTIFFIVGGILIGGRGSFTGNTLYFIISQILVAFSEELLFRGYILAMLRDMMKTPNQAVIISALVFGLWHYPVSHNISLVLLTAFTGAVYGSLRTIFEKTDDEIGIVSLTVSHWLFNIIL